MKTIIFSLLSCMLVLASCSKDEKEDLLSASSQIVLKAEVESAGVLKAGPINSGFSTDFPIGIYSYNTAWQSGSSANVINNDSATVLGAAGHSVTFLHGPYYYPSDGSLLYFFAFAPQAAETTPAGASTSPVVTHTITGQEDVMWASSTGQKVGSLAAVPPVLNFQHKLTQLQFTFKSAVTYPATENKVISLIVKAQPTTVVMNVETGGCTFSGSAGMQALSPTNQAAGISIVTAGTDALSPVMTNLASGSSAYLVDIVVKPAGGAPNVTYSNVPINITSAIGSAHMITLNFTLTAVTATATVANWITGTGGSVTVL